MTQSIWNLVNPISIYFLLHLPWIFWIFRSLSMRWMVPMVSWIEWCTLDFTQNLLAGDCLVQVSQLIIGVQDCRGENLPTFHLWRNGRCFFLLKTVFYPLIQNVSTEFNFLLIFSLWPEKCSNWSIRLKDYLIEHSTIINKLIFIN